MYDPVYKDKIQKAFKIVDKTGALVPFTLNKVQERYLEEGTGRDCILKARQQGFSSLILAIFTYDFLMVENSLSVIVADIAGNASDLLDRVKLYLQSFEDRTGIKIPLKYNSKYELYNQQNRACYIIGTADNKDYGRSKTITNLHLSEFAFYPDPERLFAGVMQAVVPEGRVVIETTANGFNYFKDFWDRCEKKETNFNPLFFKASDFYSEEFLANKRKELGRMFPQEYPDSPMEAFLSSGSMYFDSEALRAYAGITKPPERVTAYV